MPILTITLVLALAALIIAIYSGVKGPVTLWVAVVLLAILELVRAAVPFAGTLR